MVNTCSQAQQMPKSAYKSSVKIELGLKNPDYNRVIDLLEKAKVDYPDDAEIWFLLGKVYGIKNRIKDMLEAFTQANKLSPKKKQKKEMKEIIDNTWVATFNRGVDYAGRVNKVERYAAESFSNWSNYSLYADTLQMISSEFTSSSYDWGNYSSAQEIAIPVEKLKQDLYTKSLEKANRGCFPKAFLYNHPRGLLMQNSSVEVYVTALKEGVRCSKRPELDEEDGILSKALE